MSCGFPHARIALHAAGDLSEAEARATAGHLAACTACGRLFDELCAQQRLLHSLRREAVDPSECARMRRGVMATVHRWPDQAEWTVRLERAIVLSVRRHTYALAAAALVGVISASALAKVQLEAPIATRAVAVFDGANMLVRPEGYRDWILVSNPTATQAPRVYIDRTAFRVFTRTGAFPEGTLMVRESVGGPGRAGSPHASSAGLLVSVKNRTRFDGGWGFFDFTRPDGTTAPKAPAMDESDGCRTCHRREAETDHVFTQFLPRLQLAHTKAGPAAELEE